MAKSIAEVTEIIREFSDVRGWENNDPNQLIASIMIELGELAENYQWQSKFKAFDEEQKRKIGFEFVDVIFYLFRLAQKSGIDIEKYFDEKVPKLEQKFPIGITSKQYNQVKREYRESGKSELYK
jgi:NTP pyrophosphatase (non-canonical NTP hydrolase)